MWLTVLALMLTGAAFADQENAPVMLVKLPEDAQMVENVAFDDGDFIQTYQLSGGAYVASALRAGGRDARWNCGGRLAGRDGYSVHGA